MGGAETEDPRALGDEPRRGGAQRVRDLPTPWRWLVVAAFALAAVLPSVQAVRAVHSGWRPVGDVALIGLRARDVASSPSTLGQPDSADTVSATPRESSHLGPIESYLLAVPVWVLGPVLGLALGTALINGAAWASALFLAHRRGGLVLFALFAAAIPIMVWSLGPSLLHDPINSDVATLALLPLVLSAWSLLERDVRIAPLFAFLVTLVLQPHLANAGTAMLGIAAAGAGLALILRDRRPGDVAWIGAAGGTLLVLWLPPILHELGGGPSNVGAVWSTLWAERTQVGVTFAVGRAANATAPWPMPYFARSWTPAAPAGLLGSTHLVVGVLALGLAGSLGLVFWFAGRRKVARYLFLVDALAVIAVVTTRVLPWGGVSRPEHARWVWLLGVLLWAGLGWSAWTFLGPEKRRRAGTPIVAALLAVAAAFSVVAVVAHPTRVNTGRWAMARVEPFSDALRAELPEGAYRIQPVGPSAFLTMAPGVILDLEHHGYRTYVDRGPFTRGYDDRHFYRDQQVRGTVLMIGRGEGKPPPGAVRIVTQQPLPGATGDGRVVMEAWLVRGST